MKILKTLAVTTVLTITLLLPNQAEMNSKPDSDLTIAKANTSVDTSIKSFGRCRDYPLCRERI